MASKDTNLAKKTETKQEMQTDEEMIRDRLVRQRVHYHRKDMELVSLPNPITMPDLAFTFGVFHEQISASDETIPPSEVAFNWAITLDAASLERAWDVVSKDPNKSEVGKLLANQISKARAMLY